MAVKVNIDFNKYYGKISNSGSDERGQYSGGTAGDQTGNEWSIRSWYSRPWNVVLRHPDDNTRKLIAELSIEAANNNKIGYDQAQRETYWIQLSKVGYRPSKITTACEADCSSGVAANVKAAGFLLGNKKLQNVNADAYTGNLRNVLVNAGFKALTESKYLAGYDFLLPGDILLYEGHHTATNLGIGKYSGNKTEEKTNNSIGINASGVKTSEIQQMLNRCGWSLKVDNDYGKATTESVKEFQKIYKLDVDGNVGPKTIEVLKKVYEIAKSGFDAVYYANNYADVKKIYGTEKKNLLSHYYFYGKKENRNIKKPTYSATAIASSVTASSKENAAVVSAVQPTSPADYQGFKYNTTGKYNESVVKSGKIKVLLNIRKGAGKNYANLVSYPTLAEGTTIGICDLIKGTDNEPWFYISIPGQQGVKHGFALAKFIQVGK